MSAYPELLPEIEITRLEDEPFEVEYRELRWWFIVPEVGQRRRWATYDFPERRISTIRFLEGVDTGQVHEKVCCEIRLQVELDTHWGVERESYAYGAIEGGMARWYAWWHISDQLKLYTYRDPHFAHDWGSSPVRIVDAGFFRWQDDTAFEKASRPWDDPLVDPIGAGVCRVRVGDRSYRCLRTIEVDVEETERGTLMEAFIEESGRTVFCRRYNAPNYPLGEQEARTVLKESLTLTCNGTPYYLWYADLPEDVL
ncbi:MAG: hypothetical protein KY468_01295 [Armatimonadetes bacterium]|nr:hypothetical protein [Armatimonadota bacterium]